MNPVKYIKYKLLEWKWENILSKSGHPSWEYYLCINDPGLHFSTRDDMLTPAQAMPGYPYRVQILAKDVPMECQGMWGVGRSSAKYTNWCSRNCKGQFQERWLHHTVDHQSQYVDNMDLIMGFKNERDFIMFSLSCV